HGHRHRDRARRRAGDRGAPSTHRSVRLFLFDIDGTLVTARGAGRVALAHALETVYGTTGPIDQFDFRGRTDQSIVSELLTAAGLSDHLIADRIGRCFDVYVEELERQIGDGRRVQV